MRVFIFVLYPPVRRLLARSHAWRWRYADADHRADPRVAVGHAGGMLELDRTETGMREAVDTVSPQGVKSRPCQENPQEVVLGGVDRGVIPIDDGIELIPGQHAPSRVPAGTRLPRVQGSLPGRAEAHDLSARRRNPQARNRAARLPSNGATRRGEHEWRPVMSIHAMEELQP